MAFVPPVAGYTRDRARSEAYAPKNYIIDEEGDNFSGASRRSSLLVAQRKIVANTLPAWFETGFPQFDQRIDTETSRTNRTSYYAPDHPDVEVEYSPESSDGPAQQKELVARYECDGVDASRFSHEGFVTQSRKKGTKVVMRRILKAGLTTVSDTRREITILSLVADPCLPTLIEWLEVPDALWTIKKFRPYQTLSENVRSHGPLSDTMTRTALNQLFSGITSLFLAGFAHLRICADTVCLDEQGQIIITDLHFACAYGKEKVGNFYAPTQEKYASDIYIAPEVFANHTYNARKAVIWSCGVLLYFMITGQTERLRNLEHPSFDQIAETLTANQSQSQPQTQPPQSQTQENPFELESPVPPPPPTLPSSHHRKLSLSHAKSKIILYPDRFAVPSYARSIIPKMLIPNPIQRAELIEIASRVPKEQHQDHKSTRPLMEMAWLDYKLHVGPYAGLDRDGTSDALGGGGGGGIGGSSAASLYSMASNVSNSLGFLLRKGGSSRRRRSEPVTSRFSRYV